jgi:lipid II:glycine glycyltransferase (peptidoglycan interpeptide bridge formation enzyme)
MFTMLKNNIDMFKVYSFVGDLIAVATFIHDEHTAHYQFSGFDIAHANIYPMERLISEACHYYKQQGKQILHFGGGLTEDDSLHRFKKKFGNLELEYYVARGIV